MGVCLEHRACPKCQSAGQDTAGDNLAVYENGVHCFKCGYNTRSTNNIVTETVQPAKNQLPLVTEGLVFKALPHRGLSRDACAKYGYAVVTGPSGTEWEIAPYYTNDGKLQAQKARIHGTTRSSGPNTNKTIKIFGDGVGKTFFGKQLVPAGGPLVVITEGELDAVSVYEANDLKYPALSVPDGAQSAKRVVSKEIEYLNSFGKVIFMFDNDDEGRAAAQECAAVLRPGKAYIAKLPEKDANDCLVANNKTAIRTGIWNASAYRPDGIVHIKDVDVLPKESNGKIYTYPNVDVTRATFGRRSGNVDMLTSGSGMGKSTFGREMIYHDLCQGHNVGAIMLEERTSKTKQDILSVHLGKPIHKILASRQINAELRENGLNEIDFGALPDLTEDELKSGQQWLNDQGLFLYDHFGSLELDVLLKRIEYLHYCCGCNLIYLDHVSIVVSGNDGDERRELDRLMTSIKSCAERTGAVITTVCHLKKANGTAFEEGGQISLNDLRGSGALYQLSDTVLGFERHQQHSDLKFANTLGIRLLKDRFGGNTGLKAAMTFDHHTHKLIPADLSWYKTTAAAARQNKEG